MVPSFIAEFDGRLVIYAFAFFAMAGLMFRRASRSSAGKRKFGMRLVGFGLLVQGLALAAAAPASTRLAAWLWSAAAGPIGRPMDLLRAAGTLAVAAGFVHWWRVRERGPQIPPSPGLPVSMRGVVSSLAWSAWLSQTVFPLTCLVLVVVGWTVADHRQRPAELTISLVKTEEASAVASHGGSLVAIENDRESPARESRAWDEVVSQRQRKGAIFLACIAAVMIALLALAARQSPGRRIGTRCS